MTIDVEDSPAELIAQCDTMMRGVAQAKTWARQFKAAYPETADDLLHALDVVGAAILRLEAEIGAE